MLVARVARRAGIEYVGERRDLLPYPSRWCANTGTGALAETEAGIDTFFADDGLFVGEHR